MAHTDASREALDPPRGSPPSRGTAAPDRWTGDVPEMTGDFRRDWARASAHLRAGADLPAGPAAGRAGRQAVHESCRTTRMRFMAAHAERVYDELTDGRRAHPRLDAVAYAAAELFPGLTPTREQIARDRRVMQGEKDGWELDQGILFWGLLSAPDAGRHLMRAMLRPTPQATGMAAEFARSGKAEFGTVTLERRGGVGHVTVRNERFLNAEDDAVVGDLEAAVDLALLDDGVEVGVLRGATMSHPRYAGRRVFNSGINLTHLYQGRISFLDFLLRRELGYINKIVRGLDRPEEPRAQFPPRHEKPWIGAVDTFAIGGGTQITLVLDWVVATKDAYFSLPAMREGIVPGAAAFRLHRMIGSRPARQAIFGDRRIDADGPEGQLLCDQVVADSEMDATVEAAAARLRGPAAVVNRRMMRVVEEPLDLFREYMASYALEQSRLLYSRELIGNLERMWIGRSRRSA
ncbi:enoyl-CoA hydratase/isomerase family protein [Sphaerisporangium sp. TRM90804]|uniref:enoyl-CoA hydratase/isomerase family protein n=1 Tax=Sphaerisporangium sp. TRM90804 TaxID=3031113 RepID=UPI00244B7F63|nr:enoyl-CoA hydratase/isomerase family protein [Sphaerisporangium sp. TRM90804]MDH2423782.1 enoyl-CoA hydratase/isomerase family protein [Sphaerisporangium sp. TRM90804]